MSVASHEPSSLDPWRSAVRPEESGVTLRVTPPLAVIHLSGPVDLANADAFRSAASSAWRDDVHEVVVDAGGCTFMDSAGLGVLSSLVHGAAERGTMLRIRGADEIVRTVLVVSGLSDLVRLEP